MKTTCSDTPKMNSKMRCEEAISMTIEVTGSTVLAGDTTRLVYVTGMSRANGATLTSEASRDLKPAARFL